MIARLVVMSIGLAVSLGATAIDGFDFADAATAARYQSLISEFRCPKCLNESLASSNAPIATDLRRTVRRLIDEGAADDDIRSYLQQRYGDFVLYDPPLKPATWILWFSPLVLVLIALVVLKRVGTRRTQVTLTDAERERVERLVRR